MKNVLIKLIHYLLQYGLRLLEKPEFTVIKKQKGFGNLKYSEAFRDLDEELLNKMFTVKKKKKLDFTL